MSNLSLFSRILVIVLFVLLPLPAYAVSQLSISSPAGDGVFILEGRLEGVSGIHARIGYDPATLSNPRVILGSLMNGVLTAINPANPIQIAGITATARSVTSSGTIATIAFERIGSSPGRITALSADLVGVNQKRLDMAQPVIINPAHSAAATGSSDSRNDSGSGSNSAGSSSGHTGTTAAAGSPQPVVIGGTVTLPTAAGADTVGREPQPQSQQEQTSQEPGKNEPSATTPAAEAPPAPAESVQKAPARPAQIARPVQSILERFHLFTGEKNALALIDLFKRDIDLPFRQVPPVALADGKARVKVIVRNVAGEKAPRFALASARFVSVARIGSKEWEIVVTPEKGTVSASVTLLLDGSVQEIPLTVAPRAELALAKKEDPSPSDFLPFLQARGPSTAPNLDLNNDGKRDYIDDYIFTANYLVKVEEKAKSERSEMQKR